MTLWVILAAPLLVGNDPRTMTSDIKEILLNREVLAVNQDTLGKQGRRLIARPLRPIGAAPNATLRSLRLTGLRRGLARVWHRPLPLFKRFVLWKFLLKHYEGGCI
jgi:hypothetical protein